MMKNMFKKGLSLVLALAMVASLAACSSGSAPADAGDADAAVEVGTMGLMVHNQADAFMQAMVTGTKETAESLGHEFISASSDSDPIKELEIIRTFAKQDVTLLALAPTTKASGEACVELAHSLGMTVVTLDSVQPDSLAESQVGGDDVAAGYTAAKALAEAIGGSGKVAISKWPDPIPPSEDRVSGFYQAFSEYPDIEVVAEDGTGHDTLEAMNWAAAIIQQHPDVKGFISIEDTSGLGLVRAVENAGLQNQAKVVSLGDSATSMKEVERGAMEGLFVMRPYNFGALAATLLDRIEAGHAMPYIVKSTGVLVTKDNVAENLAAAGETE